ncbi:protein Brevis radix-like 1 [Salvia hispanica]|uniref:protein Brevis radix-like 1 n=1 Tax=Salvia hispanica TaxID=49212 RepID=UPI002009A776|nr:protein Brevis radix-like 1 [Salvia hispanica]
MLTCITCSKQTTEDGGEEASRGTPSTKDAVKSLTAQIKDMTFKVSRKGKPGEAEGSYKKGQRSYPDFDTISDAYPLPPGSTSSTPAWDFPSQVVLEDEEGPKQWTAQVEPGVQITFVSLPHGGNDLKRIRFSREMFNKWQAQRWWSENYDRVVELYNVQRFNQQDINTPRRSEDGREEASRITASSSSRDMSVSDIESEWIEEDEPGVEITIRQLGDGTRELRRVRFSCDKFGEVHAKHWWETNRDRIQRQYLS